MGDELRCDENIAQAAVVHLKGGVLGVSGRVKVGRLGKTRHLPRKR